MTAEDILEVRSSPLLWWQGFGRYRDEETRMPTRGRANVLQRRVFEHYRHCQELGIPCRMVVLKYRRAGSSTAGSGLMYLHAQNYNAWLGVIGTDYKASSNMLDMVKFYGEHDDFPGWSAPKATKTAKVKWEDWFGENLESVPFADRVDRSIATRIEFKHDSKIDLYTSKNPESARSAGLNGYHGTEVGRWQTGGVQDAGETLTAMRNTLPKKGFHIALEESTANGAQGAFYETCRSARWPDYADWAKQWEAEWTLEAAEFGKDLQFVFIFAAWFEDSRHVEKITPEQEEKIKATLDEKERQLIARFGQQGPRGQRLGSEVEATVWEQLAWRRGIIKNVCTKNGAEEFAAEYPSGPLEAFRASGSPALDQDGLMAMEIESRNSKAQGALYGNISCHERTRTFSWEGCDEKQAIFKRWEDRIPGCKYLVVCDPMSGAEQVTGSGEKDRHSIWCLRDAYQDHLKHFHREAAVARVKPPNQWEAKPTARLIWLLSKYYGDATIVVEANYGAAILTELNDGEYDANLYQREAFDQVSQKVTKSLGWWTTEGTKRIAISALQERVREQTFDLLCPHAIAECRTLIVDSKGHVRGSGSHHDDDCFVAGTRILTPSGEARIEDLRVGDWAMTRYGPNRITKTFSKVKPVISNLGLVGTASHPIITPEGEFPLERLIASDILYTWNELSQRTEKRSFTEVRNTTATQTQSADNCVYIFGDMINGKSRLSRFIGKFGSIITARFQQNISSIISTTTRSITRLRTWKSTQTASTPSCTCATHGSSNSCANADYGKPRESSERWPSGGKQIQSALAWSPSRTGREMLQSPWLLSTNGAGTILTSRGLTRQPMRAKPSTRKSGRFNALAARLLSRPLIAGLAFVHSVAIGCSKAVKRVQKRRVYNLCVEGPHEYFANGILVHNCMALGIGAATLSHAHIYFPSSVQGIRETAADERRWKIVN